jgi:Lipase (class 3)
MRFSGRDFRPSIWWTVVGILVAVVMFATACNAGTKPESGQGTRDGGSGPTVPTTTAPPTESAGSVATAAPSLTPAPSSRPAASPTVVPGPGATASPPSLAQCVRPEGTDFDYETALMLLDLSDQAYSVDESSAAGSVVSKAPGACWTLIKFIEYAPIGVPLNTQLFVARNGTTGDLVVAFRGTSETIPDLITDLIAVGASWPLNDGTVVPDAVHAGFKAAYFNVRSELKDVLAAYIEPSSQTRVYFTGHSLGGALATLAALDLTPWLVEQGYQRNNVVMYSLEAPRSISLSLYNVYRDTVPHSYAIALPRDPVPHLPPSNPGPNPYTHIPQMVVINESNSMVRLEQGPGFNYEGCEALVDTTFHKLTTLKGRLEGLKTRPGSAPSVSLEVSAGYMELNWQGVIGHCDWIGLFRGIQPPTSPDQLLSGTKSWQWATNGPAYTTNYAKGDNFYAGYVNVFGQVTATSAKYVPATPSVSMTYDADGYIVLHWSVRDPGAKDFVALYASNPSTAGTNGYVALNWQWATRASSFVTGRPNFWESTHGWYVAYIQEDDAGNRRILAQSGPN